MPVQVAPYPRTVMEEVAPGIFKPVQKMVPAHTRKRPVRRVPENQLDLGSLPLQLTVDDCIRIASTDEDRRLHGDRQARPEGQPHPSGPR